MSLFLLPVVLNVESRSTQGTCDGDGRRKPSLQKQAQRAIPFSAKPILPGERVQAACGACSLLFCGYFSTSLAKTTSSLPNTKEIVTKR